MKKSAIPKVVQAAMLAKADGYKYMYSVVKSHFNTTYVHVNKIDDVITNGWRRAPFWNMGWHGRVGISSKQLPEDSINKSFAIKKYLK